MSTDPAIGTIDRRQIEGLLHLVETKLGVRPLSDHAWLDLANGRLPFHSIVTSHDESGHLVVYVQISQLASTVRRLWSLEVVVHPDLDGRPYPANDKDPVVDALTRALARIASSGGGPVQLWILRPDEEQDRRALAAGFTPTRDLLMMAAPMSSLRLDPVRVPDDVTVRTFRPGHDEAEWLEVNNAAFSWHTEQSEWTITDLRDRMKETWFDPSGFLIAERSGRIAGFCWTKVHPPTRTEPKTGEIYVVAVHPGEPKTGLGRALTILGYRWLHGAGCERAMLHVDATNNRAVALYESLGLALDHVDRAYTTVMRP